MADVTTSTTKTTVRSGVSVAINKGFVTTPIGILLIVEFIASLLAWALLVSSQGYNYIPALNFAAFGFIFTWICTIFLLVTFAFGLNGSVCANLPWAHIQIISDALFALLCFIAACCVAAYARYGENLPASCIVGFIVFLLYIASFLLSFRQAHGHFPWQTTNAAPVNT